MTVEQVVRWLKKETSAKVVKQAIGWYAPTRVRAYFEVLERLAPKRRLRPIDKQLREHMRNRGR